MANAFSEFTVIQLNISSIKSKAKRLEFQHFINQRKPNLILLSETKLNKRNSVSFIGYSILRNDRSHNSGGGTAICYSNDLDCEYVNNPSTIKSFECCILKMKLNDGKSLIVASIYKPPSEVINKRTIPITINPIELNSIMNIDKNSLYIIGGDFNSHHRSWNSEFNCANGKRIYEWYQSYRNEFNIELYAAKDPTCTRSASGSNIDFGFMSASIQMENSARKTQMPSELNSDHAAIIMKISIRPVIKEPLMIKNFKQTNWKKFSAFIEKEIIIPTTRNLSCVEIDQHVKSLSDVYNDAIEKCVPKIKITSDQNMLSFHSINLLKEKKSLLRKKHRNKLSPNYAKICADLNELNAKLTESIRNDYTRKLESKMKSIVIDNNIYKNIKTISTDKKRIEMPNALYSDDDMTEKYTNTSDKVNALATQFEQTHLITYKQISVMESIVNECYESYEANEHPTLEFSNEIPANFKDCRNFSRLRETNEAIADCHHYFTSTQEINQIIKSSKPKKSSGDDQSSNFVLKKMPAIYITFLCTLLNHIINIQYFPNQWKFGLITSICKPNKNNTLISSYRPIIQLSSISKILEKKIDSRIRTHCNENKIISECQFGFQRGKSTEMAAGKFINDVTIGLNKQQPTLAILLDFRAAFDTLWHKAIIYKMHILGFDRNLICLVKSYLTNRSFAVQLDGIISTIRKVVAGAPQGGILSAIFYLLYTNDFPKANSKRFEIKRLMFALCKLYTLLPKK